MESYNNWRKLFKGMGLTAKGSSYTIKFAAFFIELVK